jgi:hypothetical protein
MTILWAGGEDIDFTGSYSLNTASTALRRVDFSRCALVVTSNGSTAISNPTTPFSSAWVSMQMYNTGWGTHSAVFLGLGIFNSATGSWIGIGNDASTANKINIVKWNGTTKTRLAAETIASLSTSVLFKIDFELINYGVNGTFRVYVNGTLAVEYTGDISSNGDTTLDSVNCLCESSANGPRLNISEVIIADEDTRLLSLKTLAPNAAGDINEWTGAYTAIDEVTLSDADVIHTDQFDKDFQCNLTGMPTGDFIVKAVKTSTRAADGIGGIGLKSGIKTNATEHEPGVHLGSTVELDGSWQLIERLYQQNPITSNRFTPAEIDALQLAYQSVEIV